MNRSEWTEIKDTSKSFIENRAYMKVVNGRVLLVKCGLVSGHWWALIDSRPIGHAHVVLSDAMRLCEHYVEVHESDIDLN